MQLGQSALPQRIEYCNHRSCQFTDGEKKKKKKHQNFPLRFVGTGVWMTTTLTATVPLRWPWEHRLQLLSLHPEDCKSPGLFPGVNVCILMNAVRLLRNKKNICALLSSSGLLTNIKWDCNNCLAKACVSYTKRPKTWIKCAQYLTCTVKFRSQIFEKR